MSLLSKVFDLDDLRSLPGEFAGSFKPSNIIAKGYPWWTKGDTDAFFVLFFDNLATQLSLAGGAIAGFGPGLGLPPKFVWENFFGGVGLSVFIGNLYYALQASKVAVRSGKMTTCAQPYGINTPGAVAKTFTVLVPAYLAELAKYESPSEEDKMAAARVAWSIACAANFFGGIIELLGAFVAPFIAKNVPTGALLVPIAGVGVSWLGFNPLLAILGSHFSHNPIVGFVPFVIIWIAFFGTNDLFGKRVPAIAMAGVIGVFLNLIAQSADFPKYQDIVATSTDFAKFNGFSIPSFDQFGYAARNYGSLVAGLAFANFLGTLSCNLSARRGGDLFSPTESMIVDGIGSIIGACFGSPYGTTVYIGHVAYSKMGATRGYSFLNGFLWLIIGMFGIHAVLDTIVPHEILGGVLIVIGFGMAAQAVESVPKRWYPAVLIGICMCFSDFMSAMRMPVEDIQLVANGYIFVSFLYTFWLMMLVDRWFLAAAGVFLALVILSFFGITHGEVVDVRYDENGTLMGSELGPDYIGMPGWKMLLMYGVSMLLCFAFHLAQCKGLIEAPQAEDFRKIQADELESLKAGGTATHNYAVDSASISASVNSKVSQATRLEEGAVGKI